MSYSDCNKIFPFEGERIIVRGAREHNLKNIDIDIPRGRLVVFSGVSGSGKSSLAFDTLFAEGQRRYMQSLSSYARQFLGTMDKSDTDVIEGLSPAIAIEQKSTNKNPRSTVGTITEIYDYYRLLYARIGKVHCPICGREIAEQTTDQIANSIMAWGEGTKIQILSPVVHDKKGEHQKVLDDARRAGFARARIDGIMADLDDAVKLDKRKKHSIEIVVDRIVLSADCLSRLNDSLETALGASNGIILVCKKTDTSNAGAASKESIEGSNGGGERGGEENTDANDAGGGGSGSKRNFEDWEEVFFSQKNACPTCGISVPELQSRLFSFNNPFGACPECSGLGEKMEFDTSLMMSDMTKSFDDGGILPYNPATSSWNACRIEALAKECGWSTSAPLECLNPMQLDALINGTKGEIHYTYKRQDGGYSVHNERWPGLIEDMRRRYTEAWGDGMKVSLEKYMSRSPCSSCNGKRLRKEALAVTVGGKNIMALTSLSVTDSISFFNEIDFSTYEKEVAEQILKEIKSRLIFLRDVGLDYLTLDRAAETLSGGEAQRIRLATQIGSALVGVMYILDEPSIGLHQRDNKKLLDTLTSLRDKGNTVIVVEHDEETLRAADYIIDMGIGAGVHGGSIVAAGTPKEVALVQESVTGQYLAGTLTMRAHEVRRGNCCVIKITGVKEHNLKNVTVEIPLGTFTCITGVSGSGKSTLLTDVLYPALSNRIMHTTMKGGIYKSISGSSAIDKVICIDQSPIGRTPRSNPATYIGVFSSIRDLFASLPDAKSRGYGPGRFSFNVKGGRCEHCQGAGTIVIEMNFLPDVYVECDVCGGKRFNRETLEVMYKGKTINDVLNMTIEEAKDLFSGIPHIVRKLQSLCDVGLGYIELGQNALTLSGGEAQRVKLANELSRVSTGRTFYIMDEPTTGLHFKDVICLMNIVHRLVDEGNTVVMIEHNLDVIAQSDYIIDMGPEGGERGGEVIAAGTPEDVANTPRSYTGQYLKKIIARQ